MLHSFCRMFFVACGLAAMGSQGFAHTYQDCMTFLVGSCLDVNRGQDPLGICQAQADAYCSNHSHGGGGGGVSLIEPKFMVEDKDNLLVVITEIDLRKLDEYQRRLLKDNMIAAVETQQARQKQVMARFRMLIASDSKDRPAK